jgi:N-acetylglucosaminyldiphosphoundecaprenol N-acetyl-beta-D-mannosaminyltransferase
MNPVPLDDSFSTREIPLFIPTNNQSQVAPPPSPAKPQHDNSGESAVAELALELDNWSTDSPRRRDRVVRPPSSRVWGVDFANVTMQQTIELADRIVQTRHPEYFVTANLNYLMLMSENQKLMEVNNDCCCILADGNPIVLRSRWSDRPLPERVTGADLIVNLAELAALRGYRMFLLGGAPGVAQAAAEHLQQRFPELQIAGTLAPPFRPLDRDEHKQLVSTIRQSQPDILCVAYGQPKGEIWIWEHLKELGVPLSIQLGASFDFLAGTARRAPRIWQSLGCEWLFRSLGDPRRLIPRYSKNLRHLLRLIGADLVSTARARSPRVSSSANR